MSGLRVIQWNPDFVTAFKFLTVFSMPLFLMDLFMEARDEEFLFQKTPVPAQLAYASAPVMIVALFAANEANAFIYFQF
jgi:hypothetical protein